MGFGWGGRIRTSAWRYQKPLPYRLATPHYAGWKCLTGLNDHHQTGSRNQSARKLAGKCDRFKSLLHPFSHCCHMPHAVPHILACLRCFLRFSGGVVWVHRRATAGVAARTLTFRPIQRNPCPSDGAMAYGVYRKLNCVSADPVLDAIGRATGLRGWASGVSWCCGVADTESGHEFAHKSGYNKLLSRAS